MPPKVTPTADAFAEIDHFYRLRDPLRDFIPLRLASKLDLKQLDAVHTHLHEALRRHNAAFPDDKVEHPGFRALLATLSFFWLKDGNKGPKPWWYSADSEFVVRLSLFSLSNGCFILVP